LEPDHHAGAESTTRALEADPQDGRRVEYWADGPTDREEGHGREQRSMADRAVPDQMMRGGSKARFGAQQGREE